MLNVLQISLTNNKNNEPHVLQNSSYEKKKSI